jgi:glycosyltransferase involved in cell wall biosynthesis
MQTLSLITASYNRAHTIRDTIRSVNMQTYPEIEHIVIDGASTDQSMAIIEAEAKRVRIAVSEPDKGFYDAYNKGLARATGDIIGFINTDDFYCSDDVIAQVMKVFEDPTVEGVHAELVYVDEQDTSKIRRHWKAGDFSDVDYRRGRIPAHPTVFVRRSVYDRVGGYDTSFKLAADYDFLLRAFYVAKIKAVYLPQIWVRMRMGGATGGAARDIKRQNDEILASRATHGLHYPEVLFYGRKVIDRTLQRLRVPFVQMPTEVKAT